MVAAWPWLLSDAMLHLDLAMGCVLIGSLIGLGGAARAMWPQKLAALSGANVVFGGWVIAVPWTYRHADDAILAAICLIVGCAVILLGTWSIRATYLGQRIV